MKKILIISGILFTVLVAYIIFLINFGWYTYVSSKIEIKIPLSAKIEYNDSHGGFHGDGESFVKVFFSNEQSEKFMYKISTNWHWKELPMPEKLQNSISVCMNRGMEVPVVEDGY